MSAVNDLSHSTHSSLNSGDWWCLAVITCAYLALMAATLDRHGYVTDEIYTLNAVHRPWLDLVKERASHGHPPLFFVLEKLMVAIIGQGEFSYRLLPMLCGLGSLLVVYTIVRGDGRRITACGVCLLLLGTSTQLMISQLARSYSMLQLIVTGHCALVLGNQRTTMFRLSLSTLLTAAAFYTHGSALIAVPAQLLGTGLVRPDKWKYIVSAGLGCLAYLPFVLAYPALDNPGIHLEWVPLPSIGSVASFPALLQFGRHLAEVSIVLRTITIILVAGSAVVTLWYRESVSSLALTWLFTWGAATAAAWFGMGIVSIERYFAPAVVCQAVMVAISLERLALQRYTLTAVGIIAFTAVSATSIGFYFALAPTPPWREMAEFIKNHRGPNESVVVVAPQIEALPFLHYYGPDMQLALACPVSVDKSIDGIWICLNEFDDESEMNAVTPSCRTEFSKVTSMQLKRGGIIHLVK